MRACRRSCGSCAAPFRLIFAEIIAPRTDTAMVAVHKSPASKPFATMTTAPDLYVLCCGDAAEPSAAIHHICMRVGRLSGGHRVQYYVHGQVAGPDQDAGPDDRPQPACT